MTGEIHERISVHSVTFTGSSAGDLATRWDELGLRRLSVLDTQLFDAVLVPAMTREDRKVEAVFHLFAGGRLDGGTAQMRAARDGLSRVIGSAAAVGAHCVYLLTGGRGDLTWGQAADRFCETIGPCAEEAATAGVALAIENASALYADLHIAHTLRDTLKLAEMAGLAVCIDLFHCWAEADLMDLVQQALPRTALVQISDYVLGDRSLPCRAVPGDGVIPLETIVGQMVSSGYSHGFDLELIGPRIVDEGPLPASERAVATLTAILDRHSA